MGSHGIARRTRVLPAFIAAAVAPTADRHDRLLRLITDMFPTAPHASQRLLEVGGVRRFGHLMQRCSPDVVHPFLMERDVEIRRVYDALAGMTDAPTVLSTNAFTSMMGGCGIVRLAPLAEGAHLLGAFFECAGPVLARLNSMAPPRC